MIRSLTLVRHTSSPKFEQLCILLRALGFEDGRAWSDEHGSGASFLAAVGSLELVEGRTSEPDILIEVSDVDSAQQIAKKHLRPASGLPGMPRVRPLHSRPWNHRQSRAGRRRREAGRGADQTRSILGFADYLSAQRRC